MILFNILLWEEAIRNSMLNILWVEWKTEGTYPQPKHKYNPPNSNFGCTHKIGQIEKLGRY